MVRVYVLLLAVAVFGLAGCAPAKPWVDAGARSIDVPDAPGSGKPNRDDKGPSRSWTGHVTAYAASRPPIPNARLQLPAVSPDAKWIAYLKQNDPEARVSSDGLITGGGLGGVSLWVRRLEEAQEPISIAFSGACWPSWSADGRVLAFVTFDQERRSSLGLYHVETGLIQRSEAGLRCVLMPAINPHGDRVAVAAYGEVPDQALIFIIDPATGQATPGPPAGDGAQLMPRWVDSNTLLYIELAEDGAYLKRWTLGEDSPAVVAELPFSDSIFDAQHLLTGIDDPLRPDIGAYTYYNPIEDRIEILNLITLATAVLPKGFRGGTWWGDDWLVASSDDRVELASSRRTSVDTDLPRLIRLITGRWLPIWADHEQQSIIIVGEGEDPDTFSLMQLWIVVSDDD